MAGGAGIVAGPEEIAIKLGVSTRTVSRVLGRRGVPYLRDCDPMTGVAIRASKATAVRYERDRPGELVHVDVKKLGKIPDGGGWRAHGRGHGDAAAASAMTTCTRWSMTIPGWPTRRSSPTRKDPPAPLS